MPSTRDIRRRIKSVKSTAQITKAMQLVAAACPQGIIRIWNADPAAAGRALFDIEGSAGSHLMGHTGPVTCLDLDDG